MKLQHMLLVFICLSISAFSHSEDVVPTITMGNVSNEPARFIQHSELVDDYAVLSTQLQKRNPEPQEIAQLMSALQERFFEKLSKKDIIFDKATTAILTVGTGCTYSNIQAAVDAANDGDTIQVRAVTYTGSNATVNIIDKSLIILGGYEADCSTKSQNRTILNAAGQSDSVFEITDNVGGMTSVIGSIEITNGEDDADYGGGVEITGQISNPVSVIITNDIIKNNESARGGGIYTKNAEVEIIGSMLIYNNTAIIDGTDTGNGGGIYCENSLLSMTGTDIGWAFGNMANNHGGGVYLDNCDLILDAEDGNSSALIRLNTASGNGGGVYATNNSRIDLHGDRASISSNNAHNGGGLYLAGNTKLYGDNGNITYNNASLFGGGFYLIDSGTLLDMDRGNSYACSGKCSQLSNNQAEFGAAGYTKENTFVAIDNSWIEGNNAVTRGSAFDTRGSLDIADSMILNQYSDAATVPLISIIDGATTIKFSTFANNLNNTAGTATDMIELSVNSSGSLVFDSNVSWQNQYSSLYSADSGQTTSIENNVGEGFPGGSNLSVYPVFLSGSYHISPNSPAVDFGNNSIASSLDIDKETRPLGAGPDAGADETHARIGFSGGSCTYNSISEAIAAATDGEVIFISPGNYIENPGIIDKSLSFFPGNDLCNGHMQNPTSQPVTIDGSDLFRNQGGLFEITNTSLVSFNNITLQNARANYGGIISVENGSSLNLYDVHISSGKASEYGGGIYTEGTVNLFNSSRIYNNAALTLVRSANATAESGGGIAVMANGALVVNDDSSIGGIGTGNTAARYGGGIYTSDGNIILNDNAVILGNSSVTQGGGIYALNTGITMNDQSMVGYTNATGANISNFGGGAYFSLASLLTMNSESKFQHNSARGGGGVMLYSSSRMTATGGMILNNIATGNNGGGILIDESSSALPDIQLTGIEISGNQAFLNGGAIYFETISSNSLGSLLTIQDSTISNNTANENGGGIFTTGPSPISHLNIINSSITENSAADNGAGISINTPSDLTISDSIIFLNVANNNGGGIHMGSTAAGTLTLTGSYLGYNHASNGHGGGIFADTATSHVILMPTVDEEMMIRNNTANNGSGGGVYNLGQAMTFGTDVTTSLPTSFIENKAHGSEITDGGGALYLESLNLQGLGDIHFLDNNASSAGGGAIYARNVNGYISGFGSYRPIFTGNEADYGGAVHQLLGSLQFLATDFGEHTKPNKSLVGQGGAISATFATIDLINTHINFNESSAGGAALYINESTVNMNHYAVSSAEDYLIDRCNPSMLPADTYCSHIEANGIGSESIINIIGSSTVDINHTGIRNHSGPAIKFGSSSDISIQHVLFDHNGGFATLWSSATSGNSALNVTDSTFAENSSTHTIYLNAAGIVSGSIDNSIVWDNSGGSVLQNGVSSSCNISEDGSLAGLNTDPLFNTTSRGQYRLSGASPAIDACFSTTGYDLDDQLQPRDGDGLGYSSTEFDMGAFEYQYSGPPQIVLTITKNGSGLGLVTSAPAGINCGNTCTAGFEENTLITLTAAATAGSNFAGWSGPCSANGNSCTLTLTQTSEVYATFNDSEIIMKDGFE